MDDIGKILIQSGIAGVVAAALWPLVNRFMNATMKQMELRIQDLTTRLDKAEKDVKECQEDREDLHRRFSDLLLKMNQLTQ